MTKKEILGLLVPCIVYVWVTADLFIYADFYSPGEVERLRMKQPEHIAKMVRKIQNQEATVEQVLVAVYHQQNEIEDISLQFEADKSRRMGWYMLTGIAAQFYVVFRINAGRKSAAAKSSPVEPPA